jgi:hypothetical protein
MDDITNQAIDMALKSESLNDKVLKPLRKKIMPYLACFVAFNIILLVLLIYILNLLWGILQ